MSLIIKIINCQGMFDELNKYKIYDHFLITKDEKLENMCNAPKNKSGIYIVYELKNSRRELVYIGSLGKILQNGIIKHRDGGLYDRITNGHQFGKIPRKKSWKQKIIDESIEALDVYWYDTVYNEIIDIPAFVEATIMQRFYETHGHLPKWNTEF